MGEEPTANVIADGNANNNQTGATLSDLLMERIFDESLRCHIAARNLSAIVQAGGGIG